MLVVRARRADVAQEHSQEWLCYKGRRKPKSAGIKASATGRRIELGKYFWWRTASEGRPYTRRSEWLEFDYEFADVFAAEEHVDGARDIGKTFDKRLAVF
jgi:hypothetical protein